MPSQVLVALAVLVVVYALIVRPWMLGWGSSPGEQEAELPGDDLVPAARATTTRAATIDAPAAAVWPWLVQMGQDRAGFYTHNWVERLLRSGIPDTHEINRDWQQLEAGALMRTNKDIGGKPMGWPVAIVDPSRALVVRSKTMPLGSYAFVLEPIDAGRTRLIVRDRAHWKPIEQPFRFLIYEPLHAYMETGLMIGIRQRVEAHAAPAA